MKKVILIAIFLQSLICLSAWAKDKQVMRQGQYVYEDGKIIMLTSALQRYDHPISPRIMPLANIGLSNCMITAIAQNAAGKWQVTYRVTPASEKEQSSYDVFFQLAPGDEWVLYTLSPQNVYQPATPLVLKVNSIKNNFIEVEVK